MTVVLTRSANGERSYDRWVSISGDASPLDPSRLVGDLSHQLDAEFDKVATEWWALGRSLQRTPSARLAHSPSCAPNISDMGLMLAWTKLVDRWAAGQETVVVVCDDPWMFRHLATRPGVIARSAPLLWLRNLVFSLRGIIARSAASARYVVATFMMKGARHRIPRNACALLCYVHPRSADDGHDAYFGILLREEERLWRVLHVDGAQGHTRHLLRGTRTVSLHAWGSIWMALTLPFRRWQPSRVDCSGEYAWLVRRAAALEGATAQAAAIAWQIHCQTRWLDFVKPSAIAWPWENHGWERVLVRDARHRKIRTIGYQHALVGRQELNYGLAANAAGHEEVPDLVACSGEAGRLALLRFGYSEERLVAAGAWRYATPSVMSYDVKGAVLFALCTDRKTAAQMISAGETLARHGWPVLLKEHPMAPKPLSIPDSIQSVGSSGDELKRLSAVVYAASTIGLEALLAGIPALRFLPEGHVALDPLPEGVPQTMVTTGSIAESLSRVRPRVADWHLFFGVPNIQHWRALFCLPDETRC